MDPGVDSQPQGEFQNLLYGNPLDQSIYDLPIEDFIEATLASLQAQEANPAGERVQTQASCLTLSSDEVAQHAVPGTPCQRTMRRDQTPINPFVPVHNPSLSGQAAFYDARVGPQAIPHAGFQGPMGQCQTPIVSPAQLHNQALGGQEAFYNAEICPDSVVNQIPDSTAQGRGTISQPRTQSAKRSYVAMAHGDYVRGQGEHLWTRATGDTTGSLPSTHDCATARKRQCLTSSGPQDHTLGKVIQITAANYESRSRHVDGSVPTIHAPPSIGSSQSSFDKEGSGRGRKDSSTPNPDTKYREKSHGIPDLRPSFNSNGSSTERNNSHLEMFKNKLDMEIRATLLDMLSYMCKVLEVQREPLELTESRARSTPSQRTKESMSLLVRIQRQFLEELESELRDQQHELVPLPTPLMRGEIASVIGKQQFVIGLANYPEEFSGILESAKRNPYSPVAFPKRLFLAIRQAWLSRANTWWNSRKEKLESSIREAQNSFLGYSPHEPIIRSS